jgi:Ca2+-binding RTX toxin-like protein
MATYVRTDTAFPGASVDLFTAAETLDIPSIVQNNALTVAPALIAGSGGGLHAIDLDLLDGTTLRLVGNWILNGSFPNFTIAGTLTAAVRYVTAGGAFLETIENLSVPFSAATNVLSNASTFDFPTLAELIAGNDFLFGGALNDRLDGLAGADSMNGGNGSDTYFVDNVGDVVIEALAGGTADRVNTSVSYALADTVFVEILAARDAAATTSLSLTGNSSVNTLIGNAGVNALDGRGGADVMQGLAGNDIYSVDDAGDQIVDTGGFDVVNTSVSYTLAPDLAAEIFVVLDPTTTTSINLTGNNLANILVGNAGNNALDGGGGLDSLQGLAGNDTYIVDQAGDQIVDAEGTNTVLASVSYALAANVAVQSLATTNAAATTALNLTGNSIVNTLIGNAGANRLDGGRGADSLQGRAGNDTYIVDNAGDRIVDTAGTDTVLASVSYKLATNVAVEVLSAGNLAARTAINLTGNNLANRLIGNAGNNTLDGGLGADQLRGGTGNDTYVLGNGADKVIDTGGIDLITSTITRSLVSFGTVDKLTLLGTAVGGTGNALANTITGNNVGNLLNGGGGNDILIGGRGKDTMTGAAGADDFDFNAVLETGKTASTRDVIRDFVRNVDDIDLSTIDANGTAAGNAAFKFLAANGAAFTGVKGQLHWFQENPAGTGRDKTIVEGDINGDRRADFQIELTGLITLSKGDFVL